MRIVFAAIPAYGHVYPMMPLALACVEAGHQVSVATGAPFVDRLPVPTWPSHPNELGLSWAVEETKRRHPEAAGLDLSVAMFADTTAEFVCGGLMPVLEELHPDLVVFEAMNAGAGIAADVLDIPAAAFSIGLAGFVPRLIHAAAVRYQSDQWVGRSRQPPEGTLLAQAWIDPTPPSLRGTGPAGEAEPGAALTIPIRSVAFSENIGEVPAWLSGTRTRPRVYVTLGTVSFGAVDVLRRAVAEVAELDVEVLVAVGLEGDPAALGHVAQNVHLERFVAQDQILPLVDLVVHHGGTGTVLGTLAAGLPQLILPQGADQFYNAGALSDIGAGRSLLVDQQHPGAIGDSVSAMLIDAPEREVAMSLADEIAAQPSPADVVPRLVTLAGHAPACQ